MKTFSAGLTAAYASGSTTICSFLRVQRTDDVVQTFTSADIDVTVGGELYESSTGLDISNLVAQASLAVDNMELLVFPDEVSYPQSDILAGRWDGAKFWLFEADYSDSGLASGTAIGSGTRTDINLLKRGTAGESDTLRSTRRFEFRGLKQALQQQLVPVMQKTCRYRLGSTSMPDGLCFVDLNDSAGFTNTYEVTSVTSRTVFTATDATEVDDFYGEGKATANDGPNAGFSQKIKSFSAGVFTLSLPMPYAVEVGDTFTFVAGCRKRLIEDCKTKFDNVPNFGGEPHVTGADLLTADPDISAAPS